MSQGDVYSYLVEGNAFCRCPVWQKWNVEIVIVITADVLRD